MEISIILYLCCILSVYSEDHAESVNKLVNKSLSYDSIVTFNGIESYKVIKTIEKHRASIENDRIPAYIFKGCKD